jgi:hypothetical protein
MLSPRYRRLWHYHLKKCGGTTLNRWLDSLTSGDRVCNPLWAGSWLLGDPDIEVAACGMAEELIGRSIFHWADVVHGHAVLHPYVPEGTFRFTVLREPVSRLISQIADWRRLTPADTQNEPADIRDMIADARRLPLRAMLEKHAHGKGRMLLDNHMTRALAAGRVGRNVARMDAASLLDEALNGLTEDYDLVALTEELDLGRNALCAAMGLPPVAAIHRLNVTEQSGKTIPEADEAMDLLKHLTRSDAVLYRRAVSLFAQRDRATALTYDAAAYETIHASSALGLLRGTPKNGATCYSVRSAIPGTGLHGRDGGGTPDCAVWTGPGTVATLYIPVPAGMQLSLLLWIRGYVIPWQREHTWIFVDGEPAVHRFEAAEGYADLLVVDAISERDFIRLDIEVGATFTSDQIGCPEQDERARGLSVDGYGWRLVRPLPVNRQPAACLSSAAVPRPSTPRGSCDRRADGPSPDAVAPPDPDGSASRTAPALETDPV